MSLHGGILGNVVGAVFRGNPRWSHQNQLGEVLGDLGGGAPIRSGMLLGAALRLIQQNGGLDGVLGQLRGNGFGAQADSWVSTGPNLPISPEQLRQSLGATVMNRVETPLELSGPEVSSAMSRILPELVNQLTPQGRVPANHEDLIAKALTMLSSAGA